MAHRHEFTQQVVGRVAESGLVASTWELAAASDGLAARLYPLGWLLPIGDRGWTQELDEERTAATVRKVLLEPAATSSGHEGSS
jgi:hypothetical protein